MVLSAGKTFMNFVSTMSVSVQRAFLFTGLIAVLQVYWEPHSPSSTGASTRSGRAFLQMQVVRGSTAPGSSCQKTLPGRSWPQLVGLAGSGAGQAATSMALPRAHARQPTVALARLSATG